MTDAPDYDEYAAANASGDGQLTPSDTLTGDDRLDPLDAGYSPPDREPRALRYGTTVDEEVRGESLDDKLDEEEPDVGRGLQLRRPRPDRGPVGQPGRRLQARCRG
jgi:hypothetical protein